MFWSPIGVKLESFIRSIFIILLAICSFGCAKAYAPADPDLFYDIVYVALYSRLPGGTWTPVQGEFNAKFTQDKTGETKDGVFTMFYSAYFEPQFCGYNLSCVCSGGVSGTFTNVEDEIVPDDTSFPYDILQPYNQDQTTTTETTADEIKSFRFEIKVKEKNMSLGCKNEENRTIRLSRFSNGNVVMLNDYRELYLVPLVKLY
jgi:hypothetical protein